MATNGSSVADYSSALMKQKLFIAALIVSEFILGAGCSARRGAALYGPIDVSAPGVARGQQVFMRECYQCHPGGEAGLGPAINNKPLPGFLVKFQVRRGIGAMPAFSQQEITPEELDDLIAFLKKMRGHSGNQSS